MHHFLVFEYFVCIVRQPEDERLPQSVDKRSFILLFKLNAINYYEKVLIAPSGTLNSEVFMIVFRLFNKQ